MNWFFFWRGDFSEIWSNPLFGFIIHISLTPVTQQQIELFCPVASIFFALNFCLIEFF
jgi:hypothetical protein